jgi:hypothetical protein
MTLYAAILVSQSLWRVPRQADVDPWLEKVISRSLEKGEE